MERKDVLEFVNKIIINGVKNNIESNVVKESILDYAKYLAGQNLSDTESIKMIIDLSECTEELLQLSTKLSKYGISMPISALQKSSNVNLNVQTTNNYNGIINGLGNASCSSRRVTDSCGSVAVNKSSDRCSSGRVLGGRSC